MHILGGKGEDPSSEEQERLAVELFGQGGNDLASMWQDLTDFTNTFLIKSIILLIGEYISINIYNLLIMNLNQLSIIEPKHFYQWNFSYTILGGNLHLKGRINSAK